MDVQMSFLGSLNKNFNKMFDGQVAARVEDGCLVLSGELEKWSDIVLAGKTAIHKSPYYGFVNEIECTGEPVMPIKKPRVDDSALEWEEPDVLIIGGGVTGCAIARELSRYKLSILLVEKEHDVAMHASGRNNGLIHSGIGLKKGSQRSKYCKLGNVMFDKVCTELGVDFVRYGQFLSFAKRMWEPFMPLTLLYWKWLGIKGVKVARRDELRSLEPAISSDIGAALHFPGSGVVNPFDLTIAYAENAVQNGAVISFNTIVQGIVTEDGVIKSVKTNRGTIKPKIVINAAGVFCEHIAAMSGDRFYSIHPRKGTTAVLDRKYAYDLVKSAVSVLGSVSAKRKHTKDGSVILTTDGTVLVGPDTVETIHREDFSTAAFNVKEIIETHARTIPALDQQQIITYFSGIHASTYEEDFIISRGRNISNLIHAAGLQTPGLTAAPAIGVDIAQMAVDFFGGENSVGTNPDFNPVRTAPPRPSMMDDAERAELIESNPDYGIIVCGCEEISKGEVVNALRRDVRCDSVDGVKRRTRAGMGRCHGSYCCPFIVDIISAEKRLPPQTVKKSGSGSELLFGSTKALMQNKAASTTRISKYEALDPEASARLHKRAEEVINISKRKDSTDDENK